METTFAFICISAALSSALITIGVAYGISKIGSKAMDAIARQPEAAGKITTGLFLPIILIEGAAVFGMLICLIMLFR